MADKNKKEKSLISDLGKGYGELGRDVVDATKTNIQNLKGAATAPINAVQEGVGMIQQAGQRFVSGVREGYRPSSPSTALAAEFEGLPATPPDLTQNFPPPNPVGPSRDPIPSQPGIISRVSAAPRNPTERSAGGTKQSDDGTNIIRGLNNQVAGGIGKIDRSELYTGPDPGGPYRKTKDGTYINIQTGDYLAKGGLYQDSEEDRFNKMLRQTQKADRDYAKFITGLVSRYSGRQHRRNHPTERGSLVASVLRSLGRTPTTGATSLYDTGVQAERNRLEKETALREIAARERIASQRNRSAERVAEIGANARGTKYPRPTIFNIEDELGAKTPYALLPTGEGGYATRNLKESVQGLGAQYSSAEDVREAYRNKEISRGEAEKIIADRFPIQ